MALEKNKKKQHQVPAGSDSKPPGAHNAQTLNFKRCRLPYSEVPTRLSRHAVLNNFTGFDGTYPFYFYKMCDAGDQASSSKSSYVETAFPLDHDETQVLSTEEMEDAAKDLNQKMTDLLKEDIPDPPVVGQLKEGFNVYAVEYSTAV